MMYKITIADHDTLINNSCILSSNRGAPSYTFKDSIILLQSLSGKTLYTSMKNKPRWVDWHDKGITYGYETNEAGWLGWIPECVVINEEVIND